MRDIILKIFTFLIAFTVSVSYSDPVKYDSVCTFSWKLMYLFNFISRHTKSPLENKDTIIIDTSIIPKTDCEIIMKRWADLTSRTIDCDDELLHNLIKLAPKPIDYIIRLAEPRMVRSMIATELNGASDPTNVTTVEFFTRIANYILPKLTIENKYRIFTQLQDYFKEIANGKVQPVLKTSYEGENVSWENLLELSKKSIQPYSVLINELFNNDHAYSLYASKLGIDSIKDDYERAKEDTDFRSALELKIFGHDSIAKELDLKSGNFDLAVQVQTKIFSELCIMGPHSCTIMKNLDLNTLFEAYLATIRSKQDVIWNSDALLDSMLPDLIDRRGGDPFKKAIESSFEVDVNKVTISNSLPSIIESAVKVKTIEKFLSQLLSERIGNEALQKRLYQLDGETISRLQVEEFECQMGMLLAGQIVTNCKDFVEYLDNQLLEKSLYRDILKNLDMDVFRKALKNLLNSAINKISQAEAEELAELYFQEVAQMTQLPENVKAALLGEVERNGCNIKELPTDISFPLVGNASSEIFPTSERLATYVNKIQEQVANKLLEDIQPKWLAETPIFKDKSPAEKCRIYEGFKSDSPERFNLILKAMLEESSVAKGLIEDKELTGSISLLKFLDKKADDTEKQFLDGFEDEVLQQLFEFILENSIDIPRYDASEFIYEIAQVFPEKIESIIRERGLISKEREITLVWNKYKSVKEIVQGTINDLPKTTKSIVVDSDCKTINQYRQDLAENTDECAEKVCQNLGKIWGEPQNMIINALDRRLVLKVVAEMVEKKVTDEDLFKALSNESQKLSSNQKGILIQSLQKHFEKEFDGLSIGDINWQESMSWDELVKQIKDSIRTYSVLFKELYDDTFYEKYKASIDLKKYYHNAKNNPKFKSALELRAKAHPEIQEKIDLELPNLNLEDSTGFIIKKLCVSDRDSEICSLLSELANPVLYEIYLELLRTEGIHSMKIEKVPESIFNKLAKYNEGNTLKNAIGSLFKIQPNQVILEGNMNEILARAKKQKIIRDLMDKLPTKSQHNTFLQGRLKSLELSELEQITSTNVDCAVVLLAFNGSVGGCSKLLEVLELKINNLTLKGLVKSADSNNFAKIVRDFLSNQKPESFSKEKATSLVELYFSSTFKQGPPWKIKEFLIKEVQKQGCQIDLSDKLDFPPVGETESIMDYANKLVKTTAYSLWKHIDPAWLADAPYIQNQSGTEQCLLYKTIQEKPKELDKIILKAAGENYLLARKAFELISSNKSNELKQQIVSDLKFKVEGTDILSEITDEGLIDLLVGFLKKEGGKPGDFMLHIARNVFPSKTASCIRHLTGLFDGTEIILASANSFDDLIYLTVQEVLNNDVVLLGEIDEGLASEMSKFSFFEERSKVLFKYLMERKGSEYETILFGKLKDKIDIYKSARDFFHRLRSMEKSTKLDLGVVFLNNIEVVELKDAIMEILGFSTKDINITIRKDAPNVDSMMEQARREAIRKILARKKHYFLSSLPETTDKDFDQQLDTLLLKSYPFIQLPEIKRHFMQWLNDENSKDFVIDIQLQQKYIVENFFEENWRGQATKYIKKIQDPGTLGRIQKNCLEIAVKFQLTTFPLENCSDQFTLVVKGLQDVGKDGRLDALSSALANLDNRNNIISEVARTLSPDDTHEKIIRLFEDGLFDQVKKSGRLSYLADNIAMLERANNQYKVDILGALVPPEGMDQKDLNSFWKSVTRDMEERYTLQTKGTGELKNLSAMVVQIRPMGLLKLLKDEPKFEDDPVSGEFIRLAMSSQETTGKIYSAYLKWLATQKPFDPQEFISHVAKSIVPEIGKAMMEEIFPDKQVDLNWKKGNFKAVILNALNYNQTPQTWEKLAKLVDSAKDEKGFYQEAGYSNLKIERVYEKLLDMRRRPGFWHLRTAEDELFENFANLALMKRLTFVKTVPDKDKAVADYFLGKSCPMKPLIFELFTTTPKICKQVNSYTNQQIFNAYTRVLRELAPGQREQYRPEELAEKMEKALTTK